jgi:nitrite reductase (NO-forming)
MYVVGGLMFSLLVSSQAFADVAELTTAPAVPKPVNRTTPATVVVNFEAKEYVGDLAEGKKYKFWSYGTVPGPMARVRVGDTVEFHLKNPKENSQPHNIDIHAVNGPGGGASVSTAAPGEEKVFTFKAMNPGLYIYHCAAGAIVDHISNGMYGLILVEPAKGLSKVDQEFYVFQSEFFTKPSSDASVLELSMEKGLAEHSDYVVFNGQSGALMGDKVLKAKVGDKVRIYFGNIGPNSASSFHVIGEIFDNVYVEGNIGGTINHNVQTVLVPSAGATIVEFKIDYPGNYILVDHSIFRVAKGAIGMIAAEGKADDKVIKSLNKEPLDPKAAH